MYALGQLFDITDKRELSILARMGSGSAIRSIFGGFVQWIAGTDSETSIAKQIVDHKYWPEMRVLILVVSDKQKETASTAGMQNSVKTSALINHRATVVVPERIKSITQAILEKDFNKFAEITMRDSNQFHAIAQDTWPPIQYMNDVSWQVVRLVHSYNAFYGKNKVAYTFDAGPNACLYLLDDNLPEFFTLVNHYFQNQSVNDYIRGRSSPPKVDISADLQKALDARSHTIRQNALSYIINTTIGDGPQVLNESDSLLNSNGLPK